MKLNKSLNKIFITEGVGSKIKNIFLKKYGINTRLNNKYLNLKRNHISKLRKIIAYEKQRYYKSFGSAIDIVQRAHISFAIKNRTYKGIRHKYRYPVNGQRTHTNAKTRKKVFKYKKKKKNSSKVFNNKKIFSR